MNTKRKIRVMSVFGTRPEAIKMAPLVRLLKEDADFDSSVCVTAQHRALLDDVLQRFDIVPDDDLNLMRDGQTLTSVTTGVMTKLEAVLQQRKPDIVLVHGDTTTSMAAALAAFYQQIPVGHVEAGLRSNDPLSPYPEEMNRVITGRIASLHFAPTERSRDNLAREGVTQGVHVVGNTVIDALRMMVSGDYVYQDETLRSLPLSEGRWIVLTAHRRENLGEPMKQIFAGVRRLVDKYDDVRVIYPMHPNPLVRAIAQEMLGGMERIHLTEPLSVQDMHNLLARCAFVMTDSGGLQEEAPALGRPVVVLRTETERPEVIEAGMALLAGVETEGVFAAGDALLGNQELYDRMRHAVNPYGDGHASEKIIEILRKYAANKMS